MDKTAKQLAQKGRNGDTRLVHLTPGEVVVPKSVQPAVLGLLADAFAQNGHSLDRYTVGDKASKNPRTGLLEFFDDDGGLGAGKAAAAADDAGGRGKAAMGGVDGERGWGGRDRGDGNDADVIGRAMMDQNAAPLGYGRFTGETTPGTLDRMRDNMREAGYRGTGISDTMSDMGVGYGTRAGLLGYGTALGTTGEKIGNFFGGLLGGMTLGPGGAILGGTAGTAMTADTMDQWGQQFARNVIGGMVSPAVASLAGPQYGQFAAPAANKLASVAADRAFANTGPAVNADRTPGLNGDRPEGIAGLMDNNSYAPTAVASGYSYDPGPVAAVSWSPRQWGTQYDPVRGLLG